MRLDKFSNPIFTEQDLFDAMYQGYQFNADSPMFVDHSTNILNLEKVLEFQFIPPVEEGYTRQEFDSALQDDWFMPAEYKTMDIEGFLITICPKENTQRLIDELEEFKSRNMLNLLRWLKYFVDTCNKENVLWGLGRGSSVASYVLFLIGVHNIDPLKYNLDWREFLR
jgi:DNA polymerase III alpha subunit